MNRREQLQDRYEDALFALLMDEIGTAEGKRAEAENERLKNDPAAAIPADLDRRCMKTIRREFTKRRIRSAVRFTANALKHVVLTVGIGAILFSTTFAVSETVRVNTINLIIQVFDTNTDFRFLSINRRSMEVGWLPEGYVLESGEYGNDYAWYQYEKSETELIHIEYTLTSGAAFGVDTEDAKVSHLEIQGSQAMLVEKESGLQLVWATEDNTAFIGIIGIGVTQEELVQVANGLRY